MAKQSKISLAIKLIIGFHILNIVMWTVGQGGSVIDYDTVADMGLVAPRLTLDPFIVVINQAIGLADALIGVPLFILAVIGLWQKKFWGVVFSWMVFGISFYWPTVAWVKQYFYLDASIKCQPFDLGTHFMLAFVFLFSIWGSWYLYKNYRQFKQPSQAE